MVARTYHFNTLETKPGGLEVQDHSCLHSKLGGQYGLLETLSQNTKLCVCVCVFDRVGACIKKRHASLDMTA